MQIFKFILEASKPYRLYLAGMLAAMCGIALYYNMQSYFIKLLVDKFSGSNQYSAKEIICFFIFFQLLISFCWLLFDYCAIKTNSIKNYIVDLFLHKISNYEISFFHEQLGGNLVNKIKDIATGITNLLFIGADQFIHFILLIIIAAIILYSLHPLLALLATIWVLSFIGIVSINIKKVTQMSEECAEASSSIWGLVSDVISNIISVRYFTSFNKEVNNFHILEKLYNKKIWRKGKYLAILYFLLSLFLTIYMALCLFLIFHLHKTSSITTGDFAYIFAINFRIIDHLFVLSHHMRDQFTNIGIVKNAISILDDAHKIQDMPNAKPLIVEKGEIKFDNVKFYHKGLESPLFKNKSIKIEAGQKVGLVGYSGAGKSTFVNLILRLYDVNSGRILIDNQDIKEITQDSLRNNISMIPQDPSLFHRSILDNIRYGRLDASDAEVIEAAQKAHAHNFILELPEGYNTLVGERGLSLSGGQRQRIAIARGFLKNSPILILDEATSQLDSITENDIQESLKELMQNKTTIVIAHRLSTLIPMDRILVFSNGKIIEDGTHQELFTKNGLYKSLWDTQVGGILPDGKHF